MDRIFLDLTLVICLASVFSIIFKLLKQPEILAYILTGIVISSLQFFGQTSHPFLQTLSQIGVTLLLFMVGLEIRISELLSMGKVLVIASLWQILVTFGLGFLLSGFFGFDMLGSFYVASALTFSSTIIVVKLLSDQHELHSLHAKFSLGILLAQDIFAMAILMFLSGFGKDTSINPVLNFSLILVKGVLLIGLIVLLSKKLFPHLIEKIAKSSETIFLASLGWVFGLAALVSSKFIGFSIEIGGFLAGVALANSLVNYQIIAKAKILRDFFIVIFFVLLGLEMSFANIKEIIVPAIFLSLFVLVVKPFVVMVLLGIMGYRKRTSFLTGISLSQISEFSLILVFLGYKLGHLDEKTVSLLTLVGLITFAVSTYLIAHWKNLYKKFANKLDLLERESVKKEEAEEEGLEALDNHVVVVGGDQMGDSIIEALEDQKVDIVMVDFDPNILKKMKQKKVYRLFGDISDLDIQQRAKIDSAKMVISTIPDTEDNLMLLRELRRENRRAKIVMMAIEGKEAKTLYKAGADYVILPHLAGGRQIANLIAKNGIEGLEKLKEKDRVYLR